MSPRQALVAMVLGYTLAPAAARAQACLNGAAELNTSPYPANGFVGGEFSQAIQVEFPNGPGRGPVRIQNYEPFGAVISNLVSTDIQSAPVPDSYTIGHIRLQATTTFNPPCPDPGSGDATVNGSSAVRIDFAYSVDNGVTFHNLIVPSSAVTNAGNQILLDVLVDPLAMGVSGYQLLWRAIFASDSIDDCQPQIDSLAIGYLALPPGNWQNTDPIPVGNVVLRTTYETPASGYPDRTVRGHLSAKVLYNMDTAPLTDYTDPLGPAPPNAWAVGDAALRITYPDPPVPPLTPDSRTIVYNLNGSMLNFLPGNVLARRVLPLGVRGTQFPGATLLYDMDLNTFVNNTDGNWIINWVRGWANGNTRTANKTWGLGAIMRSTPGVAGPPGNPWWLLGSGTPIAERTLYGTPCSPAPSTYLSAWQNRSALAIVGSQDGLFHAFDLGAFRWCDDPGTTIEDTHGWFAAAGARNYGTGAERWAYAPPGLIGTYRDQTPRTLPYQSAGGPARASADASITIADVCLPPAPLVFPPGPAPSCQYRTVMLAPETRTHPYVTAVDITDPSLTPVPLWSEDWPPSWEGDTTFQGMDYSPSVGPVLTRADGRRWEAAVTSGIGSVPTDVYLYLIDLINGETYDGGSGRDDYGLVQLNVAAGSVDCSGPAFGSAGAPVMVDSDQDGVVDRIYVADTKGCLYKVNTATMQVCPLASLGESVWAPIAVQTPDDVSGRVQIYVAGGDNPDALDLLPNPPHYHLFGIEDDDIGTTCGVPKSLFVVDLTPAATPAGVVHKVWSAPAVNDDAVYVTTSVGDLASPCFADVNNPGLLLGYSLTSTLTGIPRLLLSQSLAGNGVGGVHVYDGHLFANTQGGGTTVVGRQSSWGYMSQSGGRASSLLSTPVWYEH